MTERESETDGVMIIDGEFGQKLSISVSEIRDGIARGMTLHGASSMGALRAVECRTLGMVGHGWVYENYRSGATEADSDVALIFDPIGGRPLSIPQINVRYLFRSGLIDQMTCEEEAELVTLSDGIHYTERTPRRLMTVWRKALPPSRVEMMKFLVETTDGRDQWDRKRLDALESVRLIGDL